MTIKEKAWISGYRIGDEVIPKLGTPVIGRTITEKSRGKVVGYSNDGTCIRVIWAGKTTIHTISVNFVERAK